MPEMILFDVPAERRHRAKRRVRDVMHPLVVQQAEHVAQRQREHDAFAAEDQPRDADREQFCGHEKPRRQKEQLDAVGRDVMVVVQPVLQAQDERVLRRLRVKGETVHRVFAREEEHRAERDRPERKHDRRVKDGEEREDRAARDQQKIAAVA